MRNEASVWSYGGGVQSVALGVLIASGEIERPDFAVIADTAREASSTWTYLSNHMAPILDAIGLVVEIAPHELSSVGLYSKSGKLLIPAYTDVNGELGGQLPTFCSTEWKQRVIRRWMRNQGIKSADLLLGISLDEAHRMKPSGVRWIEHQYPLIDKRIKRADCHSIIKSAGLPVPPRSSCWCCPMRGPSEWKALDETDRKKAIAMDQRIRESDPNVFLSRDRKPLDFEHLDDQAGLFSGCDSGFCWV